jgi:hypothetical protein
MRTTLLIAALVAVTACEGQQAPPSPSHASLSQIERECGYDSQPFAMAWPCVKQRFATAPTDARLLALYLARGDFVAEQTRAGKMSDAEGRLVMAEGAARTQAELLQREQTEQSVQAQQRMANAQRAGVMVNAMAATRPVTCTRFGNQVTCQ